MKSATRQAFLGLALILSMLILCSCSTDNSTNIYLLREQYPEMPLFPPGMEGRQKSISETIKECSAYVVIKVLSEGSIQEIYKGTIDEKGYSMSTLQYNIKVEVADIIVSNQYTLRGAPIPKDLSIYEGKEITISTSEYRMCVIPKMLPDSRFLLPISTSPREKVTERYWDYAFGDGMYYITEDNLVMSAFPEMQGEAYTGKLLSEFVEIIQKKINIAE